MNAAVLTSIPDLIVEGPHAIVEAAATGEPLGPLEWITVSGGSESTLVHVDVLDELIDALLRIRTVVSEGRS